MDNNHRSHYQKRGGERRPLRKKELVDYAPALALKRIRFYTNVLEAHVRASGVSLEDPEQDSRENNANREGE